MNLPELVTKSLDLQNDLTALNEEVRVFKAIASSVLMIVHDVRHPLNMATRFVRRLSRQSEISAQASVHQELNAIEVATRNALGMLDDLLSLSPNGGALIKELVDIAVFFQEILAELSEVNVSLTLEGNPHQYFDRHKVRRVIFNLVKNAIEATQGKGTYWIKVESDDKILKIEIGNLSSHLSNDQLSKVFDLFYTSKKASGYGLGTAIAKKFTVEHGGEIWCESNGWSSNGCQVPVKSDGDYVVFVVKIPVKAPAG